MNREGKSYRHRQNNALVLVIKSKRMSAGTARHTVLVLDKGNGTRTGGQPLNEGEQIDVEEVPVDKWERNWEDVG